MNICRLLDMKVFLKQMHTLDRIYILYSYILIESSAMQYMYLKQIEVLCLKLVELQGNIFYKIVELQCSIFYKIPAAVAAIPTVVLEALITSHHHFIN